MHLISAGRNFAIQYAGIATWHTTRAYPVHRVTQYFRGRLANKGAGEQDKVRGREDGNGGGGGDGGLSGPSSLACAKRGPASVRVVSQVAIAGIAEACRTLL